MRVRTTGGVASTGERIDSVHAVAVLAGAVAVALVALGAAAATHWSGAVPTPPGGAWGLPFVGLLGLAARGEGGNEIEQLTADIERFQAGEAVDFETDRDDEIGELYDAVGSLAESARANGGDGTGDENEGSRDDYEELQRQSALLDAIFEQVPINLYVKDEEARHVRTSTPYLRESYRDVDEEWFRGKTDLDIYPEELARESYEDDMAVIESGEPVRERVEFDPADEEWLITSKVPWLDDDGEVRGLIGTSQYITDQVEQERELATTKDRLADHTQALRRLYEISADSDLAFDEKVQQVLALGRERLGTDAAFLSSIDPERDRFEVEYADGSDERLEPGSTAPISETYCRNAVETDALVGVSDGAADDRIDDATYDRWEYDCYLGGRVEVDDELYGTLCFVDESACGPFTDEERTFVELATQWVSYELERRRRERALREHQAFTDDVLDAIDDVFYILDEDDWSLRRWNESLADVTGYDDGEIGEMTTFDFFDDEDAARIEAALEDIDRRAGDPLEASILTSDGDRIPYEFVAAPLADPDGGRVVAGIGRDISERRERERELEAIIENTDDPIYIKDTDGVYQFANRAIAADHGLTPAEVIGKTDAELLGPDQSADVRQGDERVLETGEQVTRETRLTIDGEERVLLDDKYPYRDEYGDVIGVMGISRDITERKEREAELERTRNLLVQAGRLATVGGWEVDLRSDPPAVDWTEELYRIHGLPTDTEPTIDESVERFHPDDRERVRELNERLAETGEPYDVELRLHTPDGPEQWARARAEAVREDGEITKLRGTVQDVTERKEREEELRETNERLNGIIEASPDAVVALDEEGLVELWNPAAERIFGWSESEVLGEPNPFVPDEYADEYEELQSRVFDGESITGVELTRERKDGMEIVVDLSAAPLRDEAGEVVGIMSTLEDVTAQKERQRELARTRELLEQSQRLADVGAWELAVRDDRPAALSWTDEVCRIHGLPAGCEVSLDDSIEFYHPDDRQGVVHAVARAIHDRRPYEFEARIVTAEGNERWVRSIGDPVVEDGDVTAIRGSIQDVTERVERERALRERERELAEHREFTDEILDAIDDVFYLVDDEGQFERWNESLRDVTGYTDSEIAEMAPVEFVADEAVDDLIEGIGRVFETGTARVEAPIEQKDGETIPYEFVANRVDGPDGTPMLAGIGRDVSERKERERELTRTRELLQQAQRIAGVGGWEVDVTAEPYEVTWTDELYRLYGLDPDADVDVDLMFDLVHRDDRPLVREIIDNVLRTGESYDMETRLQSVDGGETWVHAIGEPVREDGEITGLRGSVQDITGQKERELALESLHEATRGLLGTDTDTEAAQLVVGAAAEVLDVACIGVYLLDGASNRLEPAATTASFDERCGGAPAVGAGDDNSLLWNCFVSGTPTVVEDTTGVEHARVFGDRVGGGLLVPLGDHGVFVLATESPTVPNETRQLVETLVATTEAAFDRIETETALRERDAELEARNQRLQRQIAITDVIRRVDETLVGASSRDEIESAVTERLAESEDVAFAWIGGLDAAGEALVPRAWAGTGGEYLDAVELDPDADGVEPAASVAGSREPTVVRNVVEHLQSTAWAKSAVAADLHSLVAVPLVYEGYFYGVLAVYADDPDTFGDMERTVFAELGESIAHSINAVEAQRSLHADALVELTLRIDEPDDLLGQIARETGSEVVYEGLVSHSDEESRLFATVADAEASAVASFLDGLVSVSEYRLVNDDDEAGALFEIAVDGETLPSLLVRHGGRPQSVTVTGDAMDVVVDVSTATDVREFVDLVGDSYTGVELASRRTVERAARTRAELVSSLFEELTERQLEVLRTAFFAGFFEWPRSSTGEDVAEMLDVTQPTVNRHLRLAQQRLLAQLFEQGTTAVES